MEFDSIHGYIKIYNGYTRATNFIKGLGKDETYPSINANMFSFGDWEIPYFYHNIMFGFAATYKNFGYELSDWNNFILKIENILRNIDFVNAQFHVSSSLGEITLYWQKKGSSHLGKENDERFIKEYCLIKTDEWYFGFGKRSPQTGYPDTDNLEPHEDLRNLGLGFIYPVPSETLPSKLNWSDFN